MKTIFLSGKRWMRTREPVSVLISSAEACNGVTIVKFKAGDTEYVVPVEKCSCPSKHTMEIDGEVFCEAEYCPDFLQRLSSCSSIKLRKHASVQALRLEGVLAEDATNPHLIVSAESGEKFVLKGYRLSSRWNPEPAFLEHLSNTGISPGLILSYSLDEQVLGILTEYIEGGTDPGSILYESMVSTLQGDYRVPESELGGVAATIAAFHNRMLECKEDWCRPRYAERTDIDRWLGRTAFYRLKLEKLGWNIGKAWAYLSQPVEEGFSRSLGQRILRTHGDLHFSQMLMKSNNFYILDFEGEPGRPAEFQRDLEPAIRDVATMLRGLSYIVFFAIANTLKLSQEEAFNYVLSGDSRVRLASDWAQEVSDVLLEAYLRRINREIVPASSPEEAYRLVLPWFVERALYEAYYEASYRADNIYAALATLYKTIPPLNL
ncbi:hypothetical protein IG193_03620 [Infirmifilum lucidum]|uniref:Aminoglycoside phosphotransferase domain-containing protein n=1 Tax=Infirmifilum lucidum TaxID=2776706 RepID=A0A7L9FI95_9CREN|nr:phosphotransferase [Infirmifilum lucidum]QOJ79558.1 hypothetical protein IG193_03620 [Infirmifilum lucidum]